MGEWDHKSSWRGLENYVRGLLTQVSPIKLIVELGVDYGYSLFSFAKLYPDAEVYGVDDFSYSENDTAKAYVEKCCAESSNVKLLVGTTERWAKDFPDRLIDVLHIDADHTYDSVRCDFGLWEPLVRSGGAIMFHDVISYPNDVGRFFNSLTGNKKLIPNHHGLGCWIKP